MYHQTASFTDSMTFEKGWRKRMATPFYEKYWDAMAVLSFNDEKDARHEYFQKTLHVDVAVITKEKVHLIDDKIVAPPDLIERYQAFSFETMSDTRPGSARQGWMNTSQCTAIMWWFLHKTSGVANAYFIPFVPLQTWFYSCSVNRFPSKMKYNDNNWTKLRIVPIDQVTRNIPGCQRFEVTEDGELLDVEKF